MPGLTQPVEILVDRWGVPHVFGRSEDDAFFGQGFAVARDRLSQIDLWRRRGLGCLAEVFGPDFVQQDRAARLFQYRGDMDREWRAYSPDGGLGARAIAIAFTRGINAYVDWLGTHAERLVWEFRRMGYSPARWQPEDVVRIRSHGLTRNLANDPHRAYQAPSLRYISHVSAPGLEVIGAGEPALPGISIGHAGQVAFGLTIFAIDQEDLYVYALDHADPRRYRYRDGLEPMRVVKETIAVKGAGPVQAELLFTRHGPVVSTDAATHRAFAVRTVWLEPGATPYFGSVGYMRARDFEQFCAALRHWVRRRRTRSTRTRRGTSAGWPPASRRSGRTGTACCPCRVTAATSGTASAITTSYPAPSTRPPAGWQRRTR